MKTAVSIPDQVFQRGERLARRMKKSRSQVYAEALNEYADRHEASEITEAYNRVADEVQGDDLPAVRTTARRILKNVEW